MRENSLHATLKDWYTREGDLQEAPVGGYLIDVVSGDLLIEIQTGSFSNIKPKLAALLETHPIRLVHPVAQERWIVRLPADSDTPLDRRKSPKRGKAEELFYELVSIPHLIGHPNLTLDLLLIREEEVRRDDGKGSWRRGGWSIADRRLLEVTGRIVLTGPDDFRRFLPTDLPPSFTSKDLLRRLHTTRALTNRMIYCLKVMGVIQQVGKRGRAFLYAITSPDYNQASAE